FNSTVEWPSRNRLRSGAANSCARVSAATGTGAVGTVVSGLLKKKFHMIRAVLATPSAGLGAGLRKRPSADCGESGYSASGRLVLAADSRQALTMRTPRVRTIAPGRRKRRRGRGRPGEGTAEGGRGMGHAMRKLHGAV